MVLLSWSFDSLHCSLADTLALVGVTANGMFGGTAFVSRDILLYCQQYLSRFPGLSSNDTELNRVSSFCNQKLQSLQTEFSAMIAEYENRGGFDMVFPHANWLVDYGDHLAPAFTEAYTLLYDAFAVQILELTKRVQE